MKFVWDGNTFVPKAQFYAKKYEGKSRGPMVIRDIEPYQSTIDGRMITSRSEHRDHLRAHGKIEVGNEWIDPPEKEPLPSSAPDVAETLNEMGL